MRTLQLLCLYIITLWPSANIAGQVLSEDRQRLRSFLEQHHFHPLKTEPFEITDKYLLGQALFFDRILSTNQDISCATCHLVSKGTSDNRSTSIGSGGVNLAQSRNTNDATPKARRNSLALWNRDNNSVRNLFWDGRVEVLDPVNDIYRSPLQDLLPKSVENALAVQALFPLVDQAEMFSLSCNKHSDRCHTKPHDPQWISSEHNKILERLLGRENAQDIVDYQLEYRRLFLSAYPELSLGEIDIGHLGNAIAHFEEIAFATRKAPWDRYLDGDESALDDRAVKGASLFFLESSCSVCHNGDVFSDYDFHSLGIISHSPNNPNHDVDFGRFEVTGNPDDKFKFRTPSLRNVTLTDPYMHDGSVNDLYTAIKLHQPKCKPPPQLRDLCKKISFSPLLDGISNLSDVDIRNLISFLSSLEDNAYKQWNMIVPDSVPSDLPIDSLISVEKKN